MCVRGKRSVVTTKGVKSLLLNHVIARKGEVSLQVVLFLSNQVKHVQYSFSPLSPSCDLPTN